MNLLGYVRHWRQQYIFRRMAFSDALWREVLEEAGYTRRLAEADRQKLRALVMLFLHDKSLEAAGGQELSPAMRILIAAYACLPILNLGIDWYREWKSVIVYPGLFRPGRHYMDHAGVVHRSNAVLAGEAWHRGPVILSWETIAMTNQTPGRNVVIHEMAHKLDMLNGNTNGYPPLHVGMNRQDWTRVMLQTYETLCQQLAQGIPGPVDGYAATSPAEFFAVTSEMFFQAPDHLQQVWPGVYLQLSKFYRQRPVSSESGIAPLH